MKQENKVSIIMPIYNAKKYLKECLESIINQTYKNIEILCVNDGSKDESIEILKQYKEKDSRINIIDKENTGVSKTRNIGLEHAQGKYIMFIDADDKIDKNTIKKMLEVAMKFNSEIVICTNNLLDKKSKERCLNIKSIYNEEDNIKLKKKEKTFEYLYKVGLGIPVWNKLIKKELLISNNIKFNEKMTYDEDMFFSWECILLANSIHIINKPFYKYRLTSESTVMKYHGNLFEKYQIEFLNMIKIMEKQKYSQEYINYIINKVFQDKLKVIISMIDKSKKSRKNKKQEIENILEKFETIDTQINTKDLLERLFIKGVSTRNIGLLIVWAKFRNIKIKIARILK